MVIRACHPRQHFIPWCRTTFKNVKPTFTAVRKMWHPTATFAVYSHCSPPGWQLRPPCVAQGVLEYNGRHIGTAAPSVSTGQSVDLRKARSGLMDSWLRSRRRRLRYLSLVNSSADDVAEDVNRGVGQNYSLGPWVQMDASMIHRSDQRADHFMGSNDERPTDISVDEMSARSTGAAALPCLVSSIRKPSLYATQIIQSETFAIKGIERDPHKFTCECSCDWEGSPHITSRGQL